MIPAISLMVGMYIITRCVDLIDRSDTSTPVAACAGMTLVVTVGAVGYIVYQGWRLGRVLPNF